jgi:hypothetical protein
MFFTTHFYKYLMAKDDWLTWALAGGAAIIMGYIWMTSQKAGAPQQPQQGIAVGEYNPSIPKEVEKEAGSGCGCQAEPGTQNP